MAGSVHFTDEELKVGASIFRAVGVLCVILLIALMVVLVLAGINAASWWLVLLAGSALWVGLKVLKTYSFNIVRDNETELAERSGELPGTEIPELPAKVNFGSVRTVTLLALSGLLPATLWYGVGRLISLVMGGGGT